MNPLKWVLCYPSYMNRSREAGFTFVELVVVGAFLIGFASLMLLVVTPKNRAVDMQNAQRRLHVARLMQAVVAYHAKEHKLPPSITTEKLIIGAVQEEKMADLCNDLVPNYLGDLLFDPTGGAKDADEPCNTDQLAYTTGYTIKKSKDNTVTIAAPLSEDEHIQISRKF